MARLDYASVLIISTFLLVAWPVIPSSLTSFLAHHCSDGGYDDNLKTHSTTSLETSILGVFSDLISTASSAKFHHSSTGDLGDNRVQASFHCWRDIPSQICKTCVESAANEIRKRCNDHKNAVIWYKECTLRYAAYDGILLPSEEDKETPWTGWYSFSCRTEVADDQSQLKLTMFNMMEGLIDEATNPRLTSPQPYATTEVIVTILETLYGVVECEASECKDACRKCLKVGLDRLGSSCSGSTAARVVLPSCWLGYDLGPSTTALPPFVVRFSSTLSNPIVGSVARQLL